MQPDPPVGRLTAPPSGSGSPILLLHPWWGLNADVKEFADRLSSVGFNVFAPDLFDGRVAATIEAAEELSNQDNPIRTRSLITASLDFLLSHPGSSRRCAGVIGFSFGAYYSLWLAGAHPDLVRSVVVYYGTGEGDFAKSSASFMGHFAGNDPYESPENVGYLEDALKAAGRPVEFHRYPGAGHWFCEPGRGDAYQPDAAALAYTRTVEFLTRTLSR